MSLQQDARLHLQREALQQRQAELRSVDQRIYELQTRLQRKKAANVQSNNQQQLQQQQQQTQQQTTSNISPNHIIAATQQVPQQQQHQQHNTNQGHNAYQTGGGGGGGGGGGSTGDGVNYPTAHLAPKTGVAALKQQLLQKQANQAAANANGQTAYNNKFANIINRANENRNMPRGNVAAVEPYIHTPQKSTITPTSSYLGNILKHAAATANTNQQNQLIQEHAHAKLNLNSHPSNTGSTHNSVGNTNTSPNFFMAESDESKLAKKMLTAAITSNKMHSTEAAPQTQVTEPPPKVDTSHHIYAEVGPKKRDLVKEVAANLEAQTANQTTSKIPKSISSASSASALISKLNSAANNNQHAVGSAGPTHIPQREKSDLEKKAEISVTSETLLEKNTHQLTVHSMPLGTANKSVATGVSNAVANASSNSATSDNVVASSASKPKPLAAGNLAVPPRKPISSVAPTSVSSSIPKMITYSPKVNRVAPNVVSSSLATTVSSASSSHLSTTTSTTSSATTDRPALPPKPHKMSPNDAASDATSNTNSSAKRSTTESTGASSSNTASTLPIQNINDNLPIKAKPLTIRKQPLSEQPRLKSSTNLAKPANGQQNPRKSEVNSNNYLYNDRRSSSSNPEVSSETNSESTSTPQYSPNIVQQSPNTLSPQSQSSSLDEPDRTEVPASTTITAQTEDKSPDSLKRRLRSMSAGNSTSTSANGKPKLTRRVSFDPLALLLDASLEGELELVKKTAMQVANPSAANDEGITALHNAICAGHIDIVK